MEDLSLCVCEWLSDLMAALHSAIGIGGGGGAASELGMGFEPLETMMVGNGREGNWLGQNMNLIFATLVILAVMGAMLQTGASRTAFQTHTKGQGSNSSHPTHRRDEDQEPPGPIR